VLFCWWYLVPANINACHAYALEIFISLEHHTNIAFARDWSLPNAAWTRKGFIDKRVDTPSWLFNTSTWLNSHWQPLDIFNISGGDPDVLAPRVLDIVRRMNLSQPLGLHWWVLSLSLCCVQLLERLQCMGSCDARVRYEWDDLGYDHDSHYQNCSSEVEPCEDALLNRVVF
jgi:hypothetical protein